MPIDIQQVETDVEVAGRGSGDGQQAPRLQAPSEALARWQELARRQSELDRRTAARDFDD